MKNHQYVCLAMLLPLTACGVHTWSSTGPRSSVSPLSTSAQPSPGATSVNSSRRGSTRNAIPEDPHSAYGSDGKPVPGTCVQIAGVMVRDYLGGGRYAKPAVGTGSYLWQTQARLNGQEEAHPLPCKTFTAPDDSRPIATKVFNEFYESDYELLGAEWEDDDWWVQKTAEGVPQALLRQFMIFARRK